MSKIVGFDLEGRPPREGGCLSDCSGLGLNSESSAVLNRKTPSGEA
jgi:hypothetical protein